MNDWMNELEQKIVGKIDKQLSAKDWTWINTGGQICTFFPANYDDIKLFLQLCPHPFRTFGAGSNVIIRDQGFNGVFIRLMKSFRKIEFSPHEIIVDAGVPGNFLVNTLLDNEFGGISFLATIPGQMGGFIKMNAGAHGMQTSDIINWVEFMDEAGNIHRLSAAECNFSYRKSCFKHNHIILRASIKAHKINPKEEFQIISKLVEYRKSTQPSSGKMAGCFFKNHEQKDNSEIKAWQLIRNANLPNFQSVSVSNLHANFIMNTDNASAFELEYFMQKLRANIFFNQGILLNSEIEIIGY